MKSSENNFELEYYPAMSKRVSRKYYVKILANLSLPYKDVVVEISLRIDEMSSFLNLLVMVHQMYTM